MLAQHYHYLFCLFLHGELKHHLYFLKGWINKIWLDMIWLINETGVFFDPTVMLLNFLDRKIILTFNTLETNWVKKTSSMTFNNNTTKFHWWMYIKHFTWLVLRLLVLACISVMPINSSKAVRTVEIKLKIYKSNLEAVICYFDREKC